MTELADQGQAAPGTDKRPQVRTVEVVVVALLVPAAFVAGWRARRGWGYLVGHR